METGFKEIKGEKKAKNSHINAKFSTPHIKVTENRKYVSND